MAESKRCIANKLLGGRSKADSVLLGQIERDGAGRRALLEGLSFLGAVAKATRATKEHRSSRTLKPTGTSVEVDLLPAQATASQF